MVGIAVGLVAAGARAASGDANEPRSNLYIVQMIEDPVVAYQGDIPGYRATKPAKGTKINPADPAVVQYAAYLDSRHDDLANGVGGRKVLDYRFTYNGFAAELSEAQAESLKTAPGVLAVSKDELQYAETSSTPHFLGLDAPDGLWAQLGGTGCAGGEIVIGLIDSGIWPESESFANMPAEGDCNRDFQSNKDWRGACETGEQFSAANCNNKLIGGRHFDAAWGGDAGMKAQRPWEYASPRDYNGHGTHTSSTAGGNNGVTVTGPPAIFGKVSGMAPRARIAMYKALYSTQDASTASGFTSDLVSAIDQAVADGVDVISYSISGTLTNFLNPAEIAFLFAADAGVFVSASAGNSGPASSTVAHPSPWITTVAASTHNRNAKASLTLGSGRTFTGASTSPAKTGPAAIVNSTAVGLTGADSEAVRQCFSTAFNGTPALDPAKVSGKIVVCERGGGPVLNARVDKSLAVQEAGGVGVVIVNVSANSLNADFHALPTVHLQNTDRAAVEAYAAGAGASATISKAVIVLDAPAPLTASFSSRGPLLAGAGNLLKPDVIGPGVDVLAAVAPPGNGGLSFNLYSGTSMSAPHVAGVAALLKERHSTWSPMMIKSALMTTGYDVLDPAISRATQIFREGAGHIQPNAAVDPGLVYDSNFFDWLAFLCGTTRGVNPSTCSALAAMGFSLDPSDMNVASIAVGSMAGSKSVTRRVTNVGRGRATYRASASMAGFNVVVDPPSLTLAAGETAAFHVSIARTTATIASYGGGSLTWSDGSHSVRIPIVVRPVALAAPSQVSGTGAAISYPVAFGYTGAFSASARGLVGAATRSGSVTQDPNGTFTPGGPGTVSFSVSVPAGSTYARFSIFDATTTPGSDLDLYVFKGTTLVGSSTGPTAEEEVNLLNPAAGTYTVWIHGFGVPAGFAASSFTLFTWALGSTAAGNMTVSAPTAASQGASGTVNLTFSGLASGTKYLGSVAYSGSPGLPNPTIVRVDP
jgi:hypothetical protein